MRLSSAVRTAVALSSGPSPILIQQSLTLLNLSCGTLHAPCSKIPGRGRGIKWCITCDVRTHGNSWGFGRHFLCSRLAVRLPQQQLNVICRKRGIREGIQ